MPDTFYTNNPDSLYNRLYHFGFIGITANNYLVSLNQVINNTIGNNDPSASVYNNAALQLIAIEDNINADNSLSANEKQTLLSAALVYRYSGEYWGNYIQNQNGGTSQIQPQFLGIHLHWKGFWNADGGGAIAGGVGSLFGGNFFGDVLGGGIGASMAHLFFNV